MKIKFHRKLTTWTTILFVLGLFASLQSDYKEIGITSFRELLVIFYGYLPTVGLIFTLSIRDIFKEEKVLLMAVLIIVSYFLQWLFIGIDGQFHYLIIPGVGAVFTLLVINTSNESTKAKIIDFIAVMFLGGISFLPHILINEFYSIVISCYIWHILIGNYCFSLKNAQMPTTAKNF